MSTQADQATNDLRSALNAFRGLGQQVGTTAVAGRVLRANLQNSGDIIIPCEIARPFICNGIMMGNAAGVATTFAGNYWTAAGGTGVNLASPARPTAAGLFRFQQASNYNLITDSQVYLNLTAGEGSS